MKGIIKWFNNKQGFGFVIDKATQKEYFVHFTKCLYQPVEKGDIVNFELEDSKFHEGKKQAVNLTMVDDEQK